jgi:hypothetical protein
MCTSRSIQCLRRLKKFRNIYETLVENVVLKKLGSRYRMVLNGDDIPEAKISCLRTFKQHFLFEH